MVIICIFQSLISRAFISITIPIPRVTLPKIDVGDCKGSKVQPLHMGQPKTTNQRGNKVYQEKDVNTLARRLITDMPGLSSNYARVMADDALNIEENYQVTYSFKVNTGTATLSTFKVVSTIMADERVSFRWLIIRVSLTYKAQIQNTIHSPARRRINFLNRRRCSYQHINRGLTSSEVQRIHSTLTAVAKKVGASSSVFAKVRVSNPNQTDTCSAWKPVLQLPMDRVCIKLP